MRVAVVAPVYRDRLTNPTETVLIAKYRDNLRAATQKANVPYLEIRELTEDNYPANEALFGELIHPNPHLYCGSYDGKIFVALRIYQQHRRRRKIKSCGRRARLA